MISMKKALIVIDVQNYFMNPLTKDLPGKIKRYVENHKDEFDLFIFTNFVNDPSSNSYKSGWKECASPPDTELVDELKPVLKFGKVFSKNALSALKVKEIKRLLEQNKIDELYICGIDTDCCVLATSYDGFDQGYNITVLENLSMTHTGKNLHDFALKMINRNIGNIKTASA